LLRQERDSVVVREGATTVVEPRSAAGKVSAARAEGGISSPVARDVS
jgi:hypothetical protein